MGSHGRDAYDALGVHPYAFKADDGGPPESTAEVKQVVAKVKHNIVLARNGLNDVGGTGKKIWLTELGWPIEVGDPNHPAVHSQTIQAELLKYSFDMIKEEANNRGIRNVFYYNDRDNGAGGWDYHDGLRELNGRWRLITYALEDQTTRPAGPSPRRWERRGSRAVPRALA